MVFLPTIELYFLRHGLAGQYGDPQYKDDSLRPLTKQGKEKMHYEARGMKALGLTFDAIYSSPYLRAQQTDEIVAKTYQIKNKAILLTDKLLPPASIKELLKVVQALSPKSKNILCVGHEPHLTQMIADLLKCDGPIVLKKGGLCHLTMGVAKQEAALNCLLPPSVLVKIASSDPLDPIL